MPHRFWDAGLWLTRPLCIRYSVVHFGTQLLALPGDQAPAMQTWRWALGFHAEGAFEFCGAWHDDGNDTPRRIAADLLNRGLVRVRSISADEALANSLAGFRPVACRPTLAALETCDALGRSSRRAVRWTSKATRAASEHLASLVKRRGQLAHAEDAIDLMSLSLQRVQRDLFEEWWNRRRPAPFGRQAAAAAGTLSLSRAA